jgi:hypothetical protein
MSTHWTGIDDTLIARLEAESVCRLALVGTDEDEVSPVRKLPAWRQRLRRLALPMAAAAPQFARTAIAA